MLYQITATRTVDRSTGRNTQQIPTFYLDSDIQGIVDSSHADRIARDLLRCQCDCNVRLSVLAQPTKTYITSSGFDIVPVD